MSVVRSRVVHAWQRLTLRVRQIIRKKARRSGDAVSRLRCKILLALVQGRSPTQLALGGLCSASQADRVAHRFLAEGLQAIADRREDNGPRKIDARSESEVLGVVAGSPQDH